MGGNACKTTNVIEHSDACLRVGHGTIVLVAIEPPTVAHIPVTRPFDRASGLKAPARGIGRL